MSMRHGLLCMFALLVPALGCDGDDDEKDSVVPANTAAAALIKAMKIDNGTLEASLLPDTTAAAVTLLPFSDGTLAPGADVLMPFGVNGDDASPAVAMLIQVGDEAQHFRVSLIDSVPAADGGVADESVHCTIENDVCANLCDTQFPVTFTQAVELEDGKISARAVTDFVLDCRGKGKPTLCDAAPSETRDASSSDDPLAPVIDELIDAENLRRERSCECSTLCPEQNTIDCYEALKGHAVAEDEGPLQCAIGWANGLRSCLDAAECTMEAVSTCTTENAAKKDACGSFSEVALKAYSDCLGIRDAGG